MCRKQQSIYWPLSQAQVSAEVIVSSIKKKPNYFLQENKKSSRGSNIQDLVQPQLEEDIPIHHFTHIGKLNDVMFHGSDSQYTGYMTMWYFEDTLVSMMYLHTDSVKKSSTYCSGVALRGSGMCRPGTA